MPAQTTLREMAAEAEQNGAGDAYRRMYESEITGKFQALDEDTPIYLRRRFAFGQRSKIAFATCSNTWRREIWLRRSSWREFRT